MPQREKFSSRLGFILISAGCAIGLGNVYRFPIITGAYGGGIFVMFYILFLLLLGLPLLCAELAVGRASQRSIASAFDALEPRGTKWHLIKYLGIVGNYLLMMFYTTISGWMLIYFIKYLGGDILSVSSSEALGVHFSETVGDAWTVLPAVLFTIIVCFLVCSLGLVRGVERITKYMMLAMFALILMLAAYCCTLSGAGEGLKFYLVPSIEKIREAGLWTIVSAAMGQAFFTLSVGIGSITVFGSYIGKDRSLLGEAITICSLDTFIAIVSGLIIFPACFTYGGGITADADSVSASFLFTTLSSIFNSMPAGRIIGSLFFLFMIFAAYSTVIAIFENIISMWIELFGTGRKAAAIINILLVVTLSLPAVFSTNILSGVRFFGLDILDFEDKIVSTLLLPIGALIYTLFCTSRSGWGWDNFITELNSGIGIKAPARTRLYMKLILPAMIALLLVFSFI